MRKELIGAVSALALMTGAAFAQGTSTTDSPATTVNPPSAMEEAPDTSPMTVTSAEEMLGRDVIGSDGEELGEVEDVIIDPTSGQARQLVISSGGFLGIGEKQIAVDFTQAKVQRGDGGTPIIKLQNVTQADVESMPEFQYSDTMTSLNRNSDTGTSTTTAPNTGAR